MALSSCDGRSGSHRMVLGMTAVFVGLADTGSVREALVTAPMAREETMSIHLASPIAATTAPAAVLPKTPTASVAPSAPANQPASPTKAAPVRDSVNISAAAVAALKEGSETPAQTAKEAQGGDRAAQKLLAKTAAQAATYKK